jgi:hypothetical protein
VHDVHPPIQETEFNAQRPAGVSSRRTGANELDPDRRPHFSAQAIELMAVFSNPETTAVRQDWMVVEAVL